MTIRDRIAAVLAFRVAPTTITALLIYAAIYVSVVITDDLPYTPSLSKQRGVNLDAAYEDLHLIAGSPHPYNSHQNDVVRSHILSRVRSNADKFSNVHVDDDNSSNATWSLGGIATYFEGTNVLVKIDGVKPELDAVLFSAHYDSVSTAPGATDDGMGVVTLLQLVDYFAQHQPKRTVVFNINNGEEDGLNGAHAFLEHPWFNLSKTFINLEGAGAGGRPFLLRTTSARLARSFSNSLHPQGSIITGDAFARGVVKSGTDYSVYTDAAMGGLDFAFYKPRSKYHTKDDSIPSLGGKAALWNMLESTLETGKALVDDESTGGNGAPVYFDLFGETLAVFSLQSFFIINIILLTVGPLLVGALVFMALSQKKLYWSATGWGRFPVAFVISGGLTFGLGVLYSYVNPFIIYSSPALVLVSCLALSYIGFYLPLELFTHFRHIPQQKTLILLEVYILWWILLVLDTVLINSVHIGGLYFVTFFYAATLAALLVGLLEHFELPPALRRRSIRVVGEDENENEEPTENTPLMRENGQVLKVEEVDEDNMIGLWFLQFLLAVPFPVILITQIGMLVLNSLSQTLSDGSKPLIVYLAVSSVAFLSVLPIVPFAHKLHRSLSVVLFLVVIGTVLYGVLAFPFSSSSPLKVFFQQSIDLDTGKNAVSLTGARPWVDQYIIPELPSSWKKSVTCSSDTYRAGLPACAWNGLKPAVAAGPSKDWLSVNATLEAPGSGVISVRAAGSRNCRLYLDTSITNIYVKGGNDRLQALYPMPREGVKEVRLWSRSWDRVFEVSIGWEGSAGLGGRVACEWAEDGIPALEEVVAFLPEWAHVTKRMDGLLEGSKKFTL